MLQVIYWITPKSCIDLREISTFVACMGGTAAHISEINALTVPTI